MQALGDIVICVDVARRQAQQLGHSLSDEIIVLSVHAAMHLLGMDHEKLTYRHNGRDFRLTDVGGEVVKEIIA